MTGIALLILGKSKKQKQIKSQIAFMFFFLKKSKTNTYNSGLLTPGLCF